MSPSPYRHPEDTLLEPDRALRAVVSALHGLVVDRGHFHPRGRGIRCPPACRAARRALALVGRLAVGELSKGERAELLGPLLAETVVAAERLRDEVRAGA